MKVKLFIENTFYKQIEIPNEAPHPYVIGDEGLIFVLQIDANIYKAVPHYNNNSDILYDEKGLVIYPHP